MTAYIHIGTEKTGTTSIQTFLSNNRDLLKKQEIIYPSSLGNNDSQWNFTFLAYDNIRSDEYCIGRKIYTKHDFKNHKKKIFFDLKKELKKVKFQELLISSEHLSSRLQDLKEIKRCKKILNILGFKEIKILVYLREQSSEVVSAFSTAIKSGGSLNNIQINPGKYNRGKYDLLLFKWQEVFNKENIIVRLFDKNEFYQGDLLKDFMHNIGLQWNDEFVMPAKKNETLDLIGIELLKRINKHLPLHVENKINHLRGDITSFVVKYFQNFKDPHLKFQISKEIVQAYTDCFEESNGWVRKEFFPHKERLFPKKDLSNYKENYELKEMKPEYWDRIAEFVADIVKTKNQAIQNKDNQIVIINNEKQKLIDEKSNLQTQINQLQNTLNALPIKKQQLKISNLEQDLINKKLQTKQLERQLGIVSNDAVVSHGNKITIIHPNSAKSRIQNHLSYKLGQAMIVNSKSLLGYIRMPFVLSYIKDKHKQEQKIYQEKIKKDPSLKLPPLESYPDYKEALKEKECLTYKLGEALIKASNNWYGGGVYQIVV